MKDKLSLKQKLFCEAYINSLGNGTEAVIKAGYSISKNGNPDRNLAKSIASENLTKPDILSYINTLLEKSGLSDENVSVHHWFLINQCADLGVKAKGIDMYYKLKNKYTIIDPKEAERNKELDDFIARVRRSLPAEGN
jgi:hypothetical protein